MFVLSKMASIVRIEPRHFKQQLPDALSDALNAKLANKVVKDVGLVIALFDILEIGESHVMAGDGASHTKVTFRLLVFRPFIEEILTGKIKSSNKDAARAKREREQETMRYNSILKACSSNVYF